jgi:hypothetical protein
LYWQEVSTRKSMGDELTQLPNRLILNWWRYNSAVNSHGDVVVGNHPDNIKIIPETGKVMKVKSSRKILEDLLLIRITTFTWWDGLKHLRKLAKWKASCWMYWTRELQCKAGLAQIGIFGRNWSCDDRCNQEQWYCGDQRR